MNLKSNIKEIKAKKSILKHFALFGLDEDIRNIIGESDNKNRNRKLCIFKGM